MSGQGDKFAAVRAALRVDSPLWYIQHIDLTCDGCECEPIEGQRCVRETPAMHKASQQSTETSDRLLPAAAAGCRRRRHSALNLLVSVLVLLGWQVQVRHVRGHRPMWGLHASPGGSSHQDVTRGGTAPCTTPRQSGVLVAAVCIDSACLFKHGLRGSC